MQNSKIEWTDHTFNAWIGCTKVSGNVVVGGDFVGGDKIVGDKRRF